MCRSWFRHAWSKWEQYKWQGVQTTISPEGVPCSEPIPHSERRERRHCTVCGTEQDFELAPCVAVNGTVGVEVNLAQGRSKAPLPPLRKKRQNTSDEERLTIPRSVSGYKDRTKPAIREKHRSRRISRQLVITGAQFRLRQDVERSLHGKEAGFGGAFGAEFQFAKFEGEPQLSG